MYTIYDIRYMCLADGARLAKRKATCAARRNVSARMTWQR